MTKQLSLVEDNSVVIAVVQNKGGSGKTSLITNLSGVLTTEGTRHLIIDADGQGNVSRTFKLDRNKYSTRNMFFDEVETPQMITKYSPLLDVIQSDKLMNTLDLEIDLKKTLSPFAQMDKHIQSVRAKYDYVLIDTPPSMGLAVGNAMYAADYILIPFKPEPYCIEGLKTVLDEIKEFQRKGVHTKLLGIVPIDCEVRTNCHSDILQQTRQFALENNLHVTEESIPHCINFASAIAYEKLPATLSKRYGRDKNVQRYFSLWQELKQIISQHEGVRLHDSKSIAR